MPLTRSSLATLAYCTQEYTWKVSHRDRQLECSDHGEWLSELIMTTKTIRGNSQFQRPLSQHWTWESPNGKYHHEIDDITVNRIFQLADVGVVPKFYTGSDHRLLRAKFFFTRKGEKAAKFKKRNSKGTMNLDLFRSLAGFWEDTVVDNIDEEYSRGKDWEEHPQRLTNLRQSQ